MISVIAHELEEANTDPNLNATGITSIWPHQINAWLQYKRGKWAIAPNVTLQAGSYYGSPVDIYGIDPRSCAQNEAAATTAQGTPVPGITAVTAQNCDFLTAGPSSFTGGRNGNSNYLCLAANETFFLFE